MSREISLDFTVKFRTYLQLDFESTDYKWSGLRKITSIQRRFLMRRMALILIFVLGFVLLQGCEDKITEIISPEKLSPPLGLKSITGDESVVLFWYTSNYESDLDGYFIYQYQGAYGTATVPEDIPAVFHKVDSIAVSPPSNQVKSRLIGNLSNGTTYSFLVVAAKDDWTKMSQPSNVIYDTPREESAEHDTIYGYAQNKEESGYELSDFSVTDLTYLADDYTTPLGVGDIICEKFAPRPGADRVWLAGCNHGQIQDLGYMSDWDEADVAPASGYFPSGYSVQAIEGHVYAVKTGSPRNYGKIHVLEVNITDAWVSFKACYQTDPGNREYKIKP